MIFFKDKSFSFFKYITFIFLILFILIPGRPGWFDGIPLSQFHELIALFILGIIFFLLPKSSEEIKKKKYLGYITVFVIGLTIIKLVIGLISLPQGLTASYYFPSFDSSVPEKSTEFKKLNSKSTRLDREINFKNINYSFIVNPFNLSFLNSIEHKKSKLSNKRHKLPINAIWEGYLFVPNNRSQLEIESYGKSEIHIEDKKILEIKNSVTKINVSDNTNKLVSLKIIYQATIDDDRRNLGLRWTDNDNQKSSLKTYLFPEAYSTNQIKMDSAIYLVDIVNKILLLILTILFFGLIIKRALWKDWLFTWKPYFIGSIGFSAYYIINKLLLGANNIYLSFLSPGNDSFTYESYSRYIQFSGDWLMKAIVPGSYYYQPYYYFVALFHYLAGESIFFIFLIQSLFIILSLILIFYIGKLILKKGDSIKDTWMLLVPFFLVIFNKPLINEALRLRPLYVGVFMILITIFLLFLAIRKQEAKGKWIWPTILAGCCFGLSIILRFNFLIWTPFILIWLVVRFRKRLKAIIGFIIGSVITLSPFILRNWFVAKQFRLVSRSNSTANFIMGTPIPKDFVPSGIDHSKTFNYFNSFFDGRAYKHIQWIIESPGDFFQLLKHKVLTGPLVYENVNMINYWTLIPVLIFLIISIIIIIKPSLISSAIKRRDYLLIGGFFWSQFITIIIFSSGTSIRFFIPIIFVALLFIPFVIVLLEKSFKKIFLLIK